jgi:hypothetical protein
MGNYNKDQSPLSKDDIIQVCLILVITCIYLQISVDVSNKQKKMFGLKYFYWRLFMS